MQQLKLALQRGEVLTIHTEPTNKRWLLPSFFIIGNDLKIRKNEKFIGISAYFLTFQYFIIILSLFYHSLKNTALSLLKGFF